MNEKKYIINYWKVIDDVYTIQSYITGCEDTMIGFLEGIFNSNEMELISVVAS